MKAVLVAFAFLILVGCSRDQASSRHKGAAVVTSPPTQAASPFGLASAPGVSGTAYEQRLRQLRSFASLPDRGELVSYAAQGSGQAAARVDGAYTWHRVGVSEEHALRAIANGHLRVLTPSGQSLDIRYDHHVEHPNGDLSWVGHLDGQPGAQTVITFGADAVFGAIGQPGKRSLRLTTRGGAAWMVETDPTKLIGIASAGASPRNPDALAVPKVRSHLAAAGVAAEVTSPRTAAASSAAATATAETTIDVLVGYTSGFASAQGGASAAMTRLNYLVSVGNEAFANSQVNARIRLVHTMQVNYTDSSTNDSALEELTGYDSEADRYTTPNAAFNALRAARETYGADLVVVVRAFRDPEQDGCGIAWLIGGARSGVSANDGSDYFGYSVVSDGEDAGTDGHTYFCRDESLVHEIGHNLGSQHDRETAQGDNGKLDADEYGAFTYSFGLKTAASAGNFFTVMAYGDEGQTDYRVFSNPRITLCGGRACGTAEYEDNARSLGQIAPLVARFRAQAQAKSRSRSDVDGDGMSDLLLRYSASAPDNFSYWIMDGAQRTGVGYGTLGVSYRIVATGDFNGDGLLDIVWSADSKRSLSLWLGNGRTFTNQAIGTYDAGWSVAGVGDVDGDGKADLLFRYGATAPNNFSYWIMDGSRRVSVGYATLGSSYRLAATGDFNGDGKLDLIWSADSKRSLSLWTGNGRSFTNQTIGNYDAGWSVAGAGDIDGDGRSDLLLRYVATAPNNFSYWIMIGATRTRTGYATLGSSYRIATTGDFNGDGKLDIVWSADSKRQLSLWTGNGRTFTNQAIGNYGTGWSIVDR